MLPSHSIILKDNTSLLDHSGLLADVQEAGVSLALVAAEDALFVGADLPFNHRHFQISDTAAEKNSVAGSVSVSLWDGGAWRAAAAVHDLTKESGIPFARSEKILWVPDRSYSWALEDTTADISELSTLKIYDRYWAKFTFSDAFAFSLLYVGQKFAKDSDLGIYYKDLNRPEVREAYFGEAKANYDVIHIAAAEEIVRDLRARQIIWARDQILEPDQFRDAAAHKAASIIYSPGGLNQIEKMEDAEEKYQYSMKKLNFKVDTNLDARLDRIESLPQSTVRRR